MATPRRPWMSVETDWSETVGWDPARLDWAAEADPAFPPPSHLDRLPPHTREQADGDGPPSAHRAFDLLQAPAAYLAQSVDLLFTPWSPVPDALASLVEAYGIDPDLHGGDPIVLRFLVGFLSEWALRRGSPDAAIDLLAWIGACGPSHGGVQAHADAAAAVAATITGGSMALRDEVLAAWPAAWWRERSPATEGAGFQLRIQDGLVLFQQDPPQFPLSRGDVLFPVGEAGREAARLTRLLPPWTVVRRHRVPSPPGVARMQDPADVVVFDPREGALLDLQSLEAVRSVSAHLWTALSHILPSTSATAPRAGMVLDGLQLVGTPVLKGPPGALEPQVQDRRVQITAGTALLRWNQDAVTMRLDGPTSATLPAHWQPSGLEVWAICLRAKAVGRGDGSARTTLHPELRVVEAASIDRDHDLVLAMSIPGALRWETDIAALWAPDDERTLELVEELTDIADKIWSEAPQGLAWSQAVLGRDWLRYQSAACAALQSAGLALESRALTTAERVGLLASLHRRLERSVPEAAARVRSLFGPPDAQGPWGQRLVARSWERRATDG